MTATVINPAEPRIGIANPNVLPYYRFRAISRKRGQYVVWDFKFNRPVMDAETGFPVVCSEKWEAERVVYVMTARVLTRVSIDPRLSHKLSRRYVEQCALTERDQYVSPL